MFSSIQFLQIFFLFLQDLKVQLDLEAAKDQMALGVQRAIVEPLDLKGDYRMQFLVAYYATLHPALSIHPLVGLSVTLLLFL